MPAKSLPWDGKTFGRLKVRGPAVAKAYFKEDSRILDDEGFFDTGDVATIDRYGYMQITDRSKDVIKSGGEWISSIDLENLAVGHPKVAEAAVIGARHPKWDERPLLVIVLKEGQSATTSRDPRLPRGQDRQVVDAGRRRVRQRHTAYRDRQDPEDGVARPVQGLRAADRCRSRVMTWDRHVAPRRSSPLLRGSMAVALRRADRAKAAKKILPAPTSSRTRIPVPTLCA